MRKQLFTVGDLARHFGCAAWQVRRLFERGRLPPAVRVGPYRVVSAMHLRKVEVALRQASYLPGNGKAGARARQRPVPA
jgi:hypothetical protein